MQSIAFFQRISSQEITSWEGEISTLPKTLELDLGNGVPMKLVRIETGKFRSSSAFTRTFRLPERSWSEHLGTWLDSPTRNSSGLGWGEARRISRTFLA
jgi:hypothetical protein